jgi:hypothetical protein
MIEATRVLLKYVPSAICLLPILPSVTCQLKYILLWVLEDRIFSPFQTFGKAPFCELIFDIFVMKGCENVPISFAMPVCPSIHI